MRDFKKNYLVTQILRLVCLKLKNLLMHGLLKIMSKMGISVISSYRGGCNFEAVGLSRAIVADYFPGMSSRISGIGIVGIEKKIKDHHKKFISNNVVALPIGLVYTDTEKRGEDHQFQGNLIHIAYSMLLVVGSYDHYKKYSKGIHNLPPISLRDLLDFKKKKEPINIDEVEPLDRNIKKVW